MHDEVDAPISTGPSSQPVAKEKEELIGNAALKQASVKRTLRYFILKSSNKENLEKALLEDVWATQRINEDKLSRAFKVCLAQFTATSCHKTAP
jgi:hypothetical protein